MVAVGPIAVLPSPLLAAIPGTAPYSITNGSATWSPSGASATIQSSDKAVLVWNTGAFNIASGETFNFTVPSGGAVLNKVGYLTTGALGTADNAIINGTLFSTGRVFVLANGNILVGDGANITTIGGLVLSTLQETSDFSFTTGSNLTYTGGTLGNITIGAPTVAIIAPQISGNLEATAGAIVSNRANVTGDVILRSVTANQALDVSAVAGLGVSGNLTVITNNGAISGTNAITVGNATGNQTASFSTGASGNTTVSLNAANDFEFIAVNAPGTLGNVSIQDANIVTLSNSTVGGSLTVIAGGNATQTAIATNGVVAVTGTSNFTSVSANSAINIANNSTLGGMVTATTNNSAVTINTAGPLTVGNITTGTGNRNSVTLTAQTGALTIDGALQVTGNASGNATNITLTGGTITQTANGTISLVTSNSSVVAYNSTAGGITIGGTVTAPRVTANSATTGGAITQTANITTTLASATSSFNAGAGTVNLTGLNAFVGNQTIQLTGSTVALTNTNNTVIGTSNVTGNMTLSLPTANTNLALGTGSGTDSQNITVGGTLAATTTGTGTIDDGNYTAFNVFGGLNLTTAGGNVTLDAATANGGLAPAVRLGQVNVNAGAGIVSVAESTTLNLGNISAAGLNARSVNGGIVDSGTLTLTSSPTANFTVSPTQSVVLDNTGHSLGTVNVIGGTDHAIMVGSLTRLGNATAVPGNLSLSSSSGTGITLGDTAGGSVSVGNLTVNSGGVVLVDGGVLVTGNASLTSADTTATSMTDTATTGRLQVTGVTTLASSGNITLDTGHDFSSVVLNGVTGNTVVRDINNITISGNASANVEVRAGNGTGVIAAPWSVVLGNLNAGSLQAVAQDGGGGISGTITQAAGTSMHIENNAAFTTEDANIIIGNNGNSFGRVEATVGGTTASRTVTLVEDSTLKLGILNTRGNSSITSRFGSIIEDTLNNVTVTNNGTLTLNAVNGSVLIGNTTHTVGTTTGNLVAAVINAPNGAAAVITNNQIALGNVNANSLTVTTTGGRGNITQTGSLKVFGSSTFMAAGNIALSNTTNNFGRVALTTTNAATNITISEGSTLNLGNVSMPAGSTGNFTATSASGDIIDTGLGGVRTGGTIGSPGSGVVTLAALNGNIVLDDPTTDFPTSGGVVFNAQNVTLAPLGQATLVLGSANLSSVAGNLTVTSAIGSITNAGDLNIAGAASFQTGSGNISLNQSGNRFGTVRFIGNQVSISQVNDMNIMKGSTAIGPAQLASTGSYVTIAPDGSGVVSFGNTVSISASSSITLPDALQAVGQMTVNAAGTKDLSALSITGDLGNLTPVNLGTGTYVAPQP